MRRSGSCITSITKHCNAHESFVQVRIAPMKRKPGKPMALQIYARSYSGLNSSIYWRMFDADAKWVMGGLSHPMGIPDIIALQLLRHNGGSSRD